MLDHLNSDFVIFRSYQKRVNYEHKHELNYEHSSSEDCVIIFLFNFFKLLRIKKLMEFYFDFYRPSLGKD